MKTTGVVICNYNKAEDVLACIQSVLESSTDDFDLYVVDNASQDGSAEKIRALYPEKLTLLENKENLGGSGGFNTGIRHITELGYRYVWCLDNDVLVDERALEELVSFMDRHLDVGMTGSKVLHMETPELIQQYGMIVDFEQFSVSARYLNEPDGPNIPEVVYSDAVAACSVLVRSSLIQKIGPLPEDNFLYWDDTEWGILCNLAGYAVASLGSSVVLHKMGAKQEVTNTFTTYYAFRNWLYFFLKYTREDRLENLCRFFLKSIFDVIFEGQYRGEKNRMKTVLFAYDDALHQKLGKADKSKYFPMDFNEMHFEQLCQNYQSFYIHPSELYAQAEYYAGKIQETLPDARITICSDDKAAWNIDDSDGLVAVICLCENVFELKEMEPGIIYADCYQNFILTDRDRDMIGGYDLSFELFYQSQKELFLTLARDIQQKFPVPNF